MNNRTYKVFEMTRMSVKQEKDEGDVGEREELNQFVQRLRSKYTGERWPCRLQKIIEKAWKGDAWAQVEVAKLYTEGKLIRCNMKRAAAWNKRAAEQGYRCGQFNLANCYYAGIGIEQSYRNALLWYRRAGENGLGLGNMMAAHMYATGRGTTQNPERALELYERAAADEYPDLIW